MNNLEFSNQPQPALNFLNNEWVKGSGEKFDIHSPYTGEAIGHSYESTGSDLENIVKSAKVAFKSWSQTPLKERTKVMFELRRILLRDIDKIANLICIENGKIFSEAKAEVMKGIEVLEFATSLQNSDSMTKMEVSRGVSCEYRREAMGVVASITPFNFPAMVPMWTMPIAITLGNVYIWKPSEKTPLTAISLANAFKEAGLPSGVLSVYQGSKTSVEAIISHPEISTISFVGSTKVAKIVYDQASRNYKRVLALGGAKNHIILLPDADPKLSGKGISDSFTGCAGQRCMAASVLLAVGDVDHLLKKIVERADSHHLGEGMGAIISKEQVDFLNSGIDKALSEGAILLYDGREKTNPTDGGYWFGPIILDNVKPGSFAATTELFGPILSIIRCHSISDAMKIENSNEYGNACSVFTSTGSLAEKVISSAKAGMVGVNIGVPVPREPFSFGGMAASKFGHGDITGTPSLNFWSQLKKVTIKWEAQSDENWMS